MKEGLEAVAVMISILGALIGGALWILKRIEKKAREKEAARQWAKGIDQKLLHLEANDGRITEELEDVRKDFGQFVQKLLFKK